MNMGETLTVVIVIFLAATLMFIFPMMSLAERNDDVAQIEIQSIIEDFVNKVKNVGKITDTDYDQLVADLYSTGNTYDISMELKVLDENPTKKNTGLMGEETKIGENVYYSIYTTQILDELEANNVKYMKKGDLLTVSASNSNSTIAQGFKNFFYGLAGTNTYKITGSASGMVTVTGSGK